MNASKTLLEEDNIISLRTALILDDGNTVYFCLMPADLEPLLPKGRNVSVLEDLEWAPKDRAWLYRHLRSPTGERKLSDTLPRIIESFIRPLAFDCPPSFKLLWSASGHGAILYINGEPWAFIDEATREGYSKGIVLPKEPHTPPLAKPWDQELFERIFPDAPTNIDSREQ